MYDFKYHRPATVRQAANLLIKNEDAKLIAGGHTLLPVMKQRLAGPSDVIDIARIPALIGVEGAFNCNHAVDLIDQAFAGFAFGAILGVDLVVLQRHGDALERQ